MSWDIKAFVILSLSWAVIAVLYVWAMNMPAGARAWAAGTGVFLLTLLGVVYAERRGRVNGSDARQKTSDESQRQLTEAQKD